MLEQTTTAAQTEPMAIDAVDGQGWPEGLDDWLEGLGFRSPRNGRGIQDPAIFAVQPIILHGEDRCPWWVGLEGEERCPWWAALHPEIPAENVRPRHIDPEILKAYRWMVARRGDWLYPPPSVLGDDWYPHWTDEEGWWVPVWFPTKYPAWLLEDEFLIWVEFWWMVRGYWMDVASRWPESVCIWTM